LSLPVDELHEQGIVPRSDQCDSAARHPVFGGQLEPQFVMVVDISVRQSICARRFQPAMVPPMKKWWRCWDRRKA